MSMPPEGKVLKILGVNPHAVVQGSLQISWEGGHICQATWTGSKFLTSAEIDEISAVVYERENRKED